MVSRCCRWVLMVVGAVLLMAAILPYVVLLQIPEPYATELVAMKLLMLPVGAICLGGAAALSARARR